MDVKDELKGKAGVYHTGADTQVLLVVAAAALFALAALFAPWISMPALRYTRYGQKFTLWMLPDLLEGVNFLTEDSSDFTMEPLSGEVISGIMKVIYVIWAAAVIGILLWLGFAVYAYRKKGRAIGLGRLAFLWGILFSGGMCAAVYLSNSLINAGLGRENSFVNISLQSYIQLTPWVYGMLFASIILLFAQKGLLDTEKEYSAKTYMVRSQKKDEKISRRTLVAVALILVCIPLMILFGIFFLNDRSYYFIAVCIIVLSMLPFVMVFEDRKPQARELLIIAVLAAIAVAGRAAFFMLPQFKPVTAVVIIAGISFGAEAGFLTGAVAGFASNMFFGQGPWTPWQMFAWGIIGFLAGLLFRGKRRKLKSNKVVLCTFGGIATLVIYGLIMDTASVTMYSSEFNPGSFLAMYASGFPLNVIHAVSTVFFLAVLGQPMFRKLDRIKRKYGILEP